MLKSYTELNYCFPIDFNSDATDEEILRLADLAAESEYKVDNSIIEAIYLYSCSFEQIGDNTNSKKICLN